MPAQNKLNANESICRFPLIPERSTLAERETSEYDNPNDKYTVTPLNDASRSNNPTESQRYRLIVEFACFVSCQIAFMSLESNAFSN